MYNSNIPSASELPSSKQLAISTVTALIVALTLLITCILPAEYGIDPTGIGRSLGLTQMGEIKEQLAQEAAQEKVTQPPSNTEGSEQLLPQPTQEESTSATQSSLDTQTTVNTQPNEAPNSAIATNTKDVQQATTGALTITTNKTNEALSSEQYQVILKPGEAAEVKLAMNQDAKVNYTWSVNQGHVNFDTHADNKQVKYHNYTKGKAVTGDEGTLIAAFNGKHGWFWRNRSNKTVTVVLEVSGDYSHLIRVL
jgi:hypothetical protein